MRAVSDRFRARVSHSNQWVTEVHYSNDGWRTSQEATFVDGTCTASALSQIRWTCDLTLADVEVGIDGLNGFSTQVRIDHGMDSEPLLPMGVYKVNSASWSSENKNLVELNGSSHEWYMLGARFPTPRTFSAQAGSALAAQLIHEVLPGASIAWECDDARIPALSEERDRWGLIDGRQDATSIARALGARIYAGPNGNWIASPVPTINDDPVWEASEDDVLLTHGEEFSDEGVYNAVVASGQTTDPDVKPFPPGIAQDLDPLSLTYYYRPITQGGFGPRPRFYVSEFITSTSQAQIAAQGMLAPYLGLKQSVDFTQLHDPSLEVGDVGIVHTLKGDRIVLLDQLAYNLNGAPLTGVTRTTATTLVGDAYDPPDDTGDSG